MKLSEIEGIHCSDCATTIAYCEKLQSEVERLRKALEKMERLAVDLFLKIDEAEYAIVGGNLIKEAISWETANSWFLEIDTPIRELKKTIARQAPNNRSDNQD